MWARTARSGIAKERNGQPAGPDVGPRYAGPTMRIPAVPIDSGHTTPHEPGMNPCPADGVDQYAEFTGHGSRYVDDVRSWQASEPADDFAAIAVYALTR